MKVSILIMIGISSDCRKSISIVYARGVALRSLLRQQHILAGRNNRRRLDVLGSIAKVACFHTFTHKTHVTTSLSYTKQYVIKRTGDAIAKCSVRERRIAPKPEKAENFLWWHRKCAESGTGGGGEHFSNIASPPPRVLSTMAVQIWLHTRRKRCTRLSISQANNQTRDAMGQKLSFRVQLFAFCLSVRSRSRGYVTFLTNWITCDDKCAGDMQIPKISPQEVLQLLRILTLSKKGAFVMRHKRLAPSVMCVRQGLGKTKTSLGVHFCDDFLMRPKTLVFRGSFFTASLGSISFLVCNASNYMIVCTSVGRIPSERIVAL